MKLSSYVILATLVFAQYVATSLAITISMPDGTDATHTFRVDIASRIEFQCNDRSKSSAWLYDDGSADAPTRLDISDSDPVYEKSSTPTGSVLIIKAVTSSMNQSRYKCENAGGWAELAINPKAPSIQGVPLTATIAMGQVLVINYRVIGMPKPIVTWSRDEDTITGDGTRFNNTQLYHPVGMSTSSDGAVYTLTATNSKGSSKKNVKLVLYYLRVTCDLATPWKNGTTIECTVETYPEMTSVNLRRSDGGQQKTTKQDDLKTGYHQPYRRHVTFVVPGTSYGGKYTVEVENGRVTNSTTFIVDGPKLPTTQPPSTHMPSKAPSLPPAQNQGKGKGKGLGWYVYFVIALAVLLVVGVVIGIVIYYRRTRDFDARAPIVSSMEKPEAHPVSETTLHNPTYSTGKATSPQDKRPHYAVLDFSGKQNRSGVPSSNGSTQYSEIQT